MDDITRRNQRESPFLRLPGEVRNRIYNLALGNRQIMILHPRLYSAMRYTRRCHGTDPFEPNTVDKLLHLTETCRQIHAETDLLVFKTNDFRMGSELNFNKFLDSISQRQTDAIRTLVWPRKCERVGDDTFSRFSGLRRLLVLKNVASGDDFYVPADDVLVKVYLWYEEKRQIAQDRLDAWEAKGIEIEYCD